MYGRLSTQTFKLLSIILYHFMTQVECVSFKMDLIHRDSPHSPFYNKSMSQAELLANDVQRSYARVDILNSSSSYRNEVGMESMMQGYGETFITKYYLGSDKFEVIAFVSITTDFVWTKCQWLNQDAVAYIRNRPVYKTIRSDDDRCMYINDFRLRTTLPSCQYLYTVDKGVYSKGELGEDAFYFHSSRADPENMQMMRTYFGCSFENRGFDEKVQGVFALGQGQTSLVSQYANDGEEAHRDTINLFSYCLRPAKDVGFSSLKFGIDESSKYVMVRSPLRRRRNRDSKYYLQLDSVSVGYTNIRTPVGIGSMTIDIGNPMTFLVHSVYERFEAEVRKKVNGVNMRLFEGRFRLLCFEDNPQNRQVISTIVFHFGEESFHLGVDAFVNIDNDLCMAIFPTVGQHSILGSHAQAHHVMQFDLSTRYLAFTGNLVDCGEF